MSRRCGRVSRRSTRSPATISTSSNAARSSKGSARRGVEVLLLTDPIDEFWVPAIGTYKEKPFKSATRGGVDLDKIAPAEERRRRSRPAPPAKLASLIAIFKLTLGDAVKDVRSSERLTDSAVCLVADEGDIDMHLERLLKTASAARRRLEAHPRIEPATQTDRAARRDGRRNRRLRSDRRICLAAARSGADRRRRAVARPAGFRAAPWRCCSNADCRRRRDPRPTRLHANASLIEGRA